MLFFISCEDNESIRNEQIINFDILNLDDSALEIIYGNGTSKIKLKATLPINTADDYKLVTFTSSGGYFFGTTEMSTKVRMNIDGIADATLVVPLDSGELFLTAEIGSDNDIYQSKKTINLYDVGQVIALNFKDTQDNDIINTLRADGISLIKLKGNILFNKKEFTSIIFETTDGLFQSNNTKKETKNTDINGEATVNYIVPQTPGTVFYTAKADDDGKYVNTKELIFQRAYADEMILEPNKILMDTINSNTINVYLKREIGKVSIGTDVSFEAYQTISGDKVNVGRFTGINDSKSDINEKVSINFVADTKNIDYDLPVFIKAESVNDSNAVIFKELELKVE